MKEYSILYGYESQSDGMFYDVFMILLRGSSKKNVSSVKQEKQMVFQRESEFYLQVQKKAHFVTL